MPFTYEDSLQGERRNALTIPSARSEVLTEQFAISFEENPIMAYRRFSELAEDQVTGPRLSADTARARLKDAGMENDLTIAPGGISEKALLTLMDRKRVEKRRQEIFSRSEGGFTEGAARLGVAVATTLSDPISAGLNFVPIAGQARYARWLNAARSFGGRAAVRVGVGAAEGVAGAAIAEVPIYAMRTQEQADYDMVDSLLNVALGGVIGAGLHATVGSAAEVLARRRPTPEVAASSSERIEPTIGDPARASEPLPDDIQRVIFQSGAEGAVARMPSMARERALREAVAQAVEGQQIDVGTFVRATAQQIETQEFRVWFDGSKVVDEAGQPLRVFHGTTRSFDSFQADAGRAIQADPNATGFYFTRYAEDASNYAVSAAGSRDGANVQPAYVAIRNPYQWPADGLPPALITKEQRAALEAQGYDGVIYRHGEEVVAFRPEQIKSAIGNSGRFDPQSQSLTDPIDTELQAAIEHAEVTLARDVEPTTEGALKAAEEEASLAMADVTELAKRLDVNVKSDPEMVAALEGAEKAERWARVAELATVCLVRGG
jgi:hypothetical protein